MGGRVGLFGAWHTLIFVKNYFFFFFDPFLGIFSPLPSTQTITVIGLTFFLWVGHERLGYKHAFQPYSYSLGPFSRGGGAKTPLLRLCIDSGPQPL